MLLYLFLVRLEVYVFLSEHVGVTVWGVPVGIRRSGLRGSAEHTKASDVGLTARRGLRLHDSGMSHVPQLSSSSGEQNCCESVGVWASYSSLQFSSTPLPCGAVDGAGRPRSKGGTG